MKVKVKFIIIIVYKKGDLQRLLPNDTPLSPILWNETGPSSLSLFVVIASQAIYPTRYSWPFAKRLLPQIIAHVTQSLATLYILRKLPSCQKGRMQNILHNKFGLIDQI